MSAQEFDEVTAFILSETFKEHPNPIDVSSEYFLTKRPDLNDSDAPYWSKTYLNTAEWLHRENYIHIIPGTTGVSTLTRQMALSEKGYRLLTTPRFLDRMKVPDWGDELIKSTSTDDYHMWREVGRTVIQEGSKLGLAALLSNFGILPKV